MGLYSRDPERYCVVIVDDQEVVSDYEEASALVSSAYDSLEVDGRLEEPLRIQRSLALHLTDILFNTDLTRFEAIPSLLWEKLDSERIVTPIYEVANLRPSVFARFRKKDEFPEYLTQEHIFRIENDKRGLLNKIYVWHSVLEVMNVLRDWQYQRCEVPIESLMDCAHQLYLLISDSSDCSDTDHQPGSFDNPVKSPKQVRVWTLKRMLKAVRTHFGK